MVCCKVTSIEYDPLSNETIYTLVFVDDAEMEKLGIVSLKRLLQNSFLKEVTMQHTLGLPVARDDSDVLGGDMPVFENRLFKL